MDAGSVTTARTVMRPAHPVQRVTSTSKVRRKRVAQSTRESGARRARDYASHHGSQVAILQAQVRGAQPGFRQALREDWQDAQDRAAAAAARGGRQPESVIVTTSVAATDARVDMEDRDVALVDHAADRRGVEGVAVRAIASRLHMARKTVRKILGRHRAPPKPALEPRGSVLDPYEAAIRAVLDDTPEMLAPAVLERLRSLGYTGGVTILRDRLRRLRQRGQRPQFLTLDFPPGEAMQVDWADFGFAVPGVPRRVSAFVAVLCYSRRLYIEFTFSQTMGTVAKVWIRSDASAH